MLLAWASRFDSINCQVIEPNHSNTIPFDSFQSFGRVFYAQLISTSSHEKNHVNILAAYLNWELEPWGFRLDDNRR